MSQCERLLNRLKDGPINPLQSWQELGIYRLGARVFDLRQDGHDVKKKTVIVLNRFGEECRVAEYSLD